MATKQQVQDGYQQAISEVEQALKTHCKIVKKTKSEAGRNVFIIERLAKIGKPLTRQQKQYREVDLTGDVTWKVDLGTYDATHLGRGWEYLYNFGYNSFGSSESVCLPYGLECRRDVRG